MRYKYEESEEDILDKIFISTLPWISYTALIQPVPVPADSNPRISWGRYFVQDGKTFLPVTVLCHHGLVDGIHIGNFYRLLEKRWNCLERGRDENRKGQNHNPDCR